MLSKGLQSASYRALLEKQAAEDKERQDKLEELRRKKLREEIVRKREEEDARQRLIMGRKKKEQEAQEAKLEQERQEAKARRKAEEKESKRPLSVEEAKARRIQADAVRNAAGLAKERQSLPSAKKISSSYSSLLANAPTKLETIAPVRTSLTKTPMPKQASRSSDHKTRGTTAALPKARSPAAADASKDMSAQLRTASASSSKLSKAIQRRLPSDAPDLVPLQKQKRDLRTIEQIQNDLHRQKGKQYAYLNTPLTEPLSSATNRSSSKSPTKSAIPAQGRSSTIGPIDRQKTSAPSKTSGYSASKRARQRSPASSEDSFVSDSPPRRGNAHRPHHGLAEGESIWDILNPGKKRATYLARDIDSDEEDMEANAADIRREEARAARAAKLEDEREERALREQEERKAALKRRRVG